MPLPALLKQRSAFVPVLMSAGALGVVILRLVLVGTAPGTDEDAAAHGWQLLMGLQAPVIAFFLAKWLRRDTRQAVQVLAIQLGAAVVAAAPVFILRW